MSQVFRIALPDKNAERGKPDEMAVDSRYSNPKIDTQANPPHAGTIRLTWNDTTPIGNGTTKLLYSFAHQYGYVPTVIASYRFDNGINVLKGTLPFQLGAFGVLTIDADEKNVNLKYYSVDTSGDPTPTFAMQIHYYVMAERGYE